MTISVVTATYNHDRTLPLLYRSLLQNHIFVHEWLICDDGSTDATWPLINSYERQAPFPVRGTRQTHDGMRLARNINHGLKLATGDLLFIVMGDSYLRIDTLAQLKRDYREGSAGCGLRLNIELTGEFRSFDWRVPQGDHGTRPVTVVHELTGNSMIVKREDLAQIGWWDEGYEGYGRDDLDVFLRLQRRGVALYQYNDVRIKHVYHGEKQSENPASVARFEQEELRSGDAL